MRRRLAFAYGVVAYLAFLATIAYAVGFLANVGVPKSIDAGTTVAAGDALLVDVALLGLFGAQHSLMARPGFKARWTRLVPEPIERSTYVLLSSAALAVLMWGWQPLPETVWSVDAPAAYAVWAVYVVGWVVAVAAINMIDKDDLVGLRQVKAYRRGEDLEPLDFQTPGLYRYVRHPLMTGLLLAFWATPRLTVGHLVFAAGATAYVLLGVALEERDLVAAFGEEYRAYRREVPMLVPRPWRSLPEQGDGPEGAR